MPEILQSSGSNTAKTMKRLYFLGLILGVTLLTARGDIIPTLSTTTPSGSGFSWNYSANVTVDQTVKPGDFFTIYDFGNFVSGSNLQPVGWVFSNALTGINPSLVIPADNGSIMNLTWTYEGTSAIPGSAVLGAFSIVTDTNQLRTSDFAAEATRSTGPNAGTKVDNVGSVSVPVPEMSALLPILSVCGAGLVSLLPSLLRRRNAA
jgi:hypothetical protein